jgi:hypothetical protein
MRRRLLQNAVRLGLAAIVSVLLLELGVRFVLFSDLAADWDAAARLRSPGRLGYTTLDDEYWVLRARFQPASRRRPAPGYDPALGWIGEGQIFPGNYDHAQRASLAGRRPVLLYGDSYAQCTTPPGDCFEGALEETELGRRFRLVNYGLGGYGLDQVHLLLRRSIDAWTALEPVVAVGILLDDDLDRCGLSFRDWPKPRLELRGDELVPDRPAVLTLEQALAAAPAGPPSYALRLLLHGRRPTDLLKPDGGERERRNRELCERILGETVELLRSREVDYFFVLFYGPESVQNTARLAWRERLVVDTLDALDAPWVSTRRVILEHQVKTGRDPRQLYDASNHLNAEGNRVALVAMTDGLEGLFGLRGTAGALSAAMISETVLRGERAAARYESGTRPPFTEPADRTRLCMRVGAEGPTEVVYLLEGRARAFEARARLIPLAGETEGSVGLTVLVDDEPAFRGTLRRDGKELAVRVDLAGRGRMVVLADDAGDGIRGDWLVLAEPRFEPAD